MITVHLFIIILLPGICYLWASARTALPLLFESSFVNLFYPCASFFPFFWVQICFYLFHVILHVDSSFSKSIIFSFLILSWVVCVLLLVVNFIFKHYNTVSFYKCCSKSFKAHWTLISAVLSHLNHTKVHKSVVSHLNHIELYKCCIKSFKSHWAK